MFLPVLSFVTDSTVRRRCDLVLIRQLTDDALESAHGRRGFTAYGLAEGPTNLVFAL